jgi:hypothetical protein
VESRHRFARPGDSFFGKMPKEKRMMGMTQSAAMHDSKKANIEYTVYTFQRGEGNAKSLERWQKQAMFNDLPSATKKAEELYNSGDFCKVEIKQKYTDSKNQRVIDITLKTYEKKEKRSLGVAVLTGMAAACGVVAFMVAYYFGQN